MSTSTTEFNRTLTLARRFARILDIEERPEKEPRQSSYKVDTGRQPRDYLLIHGVLIGMGAAWRSDVLVPVPDREDVCVSSFAIDVDLVIRIRTEGHDSDGSIVVFFEEKSPGGPPAAHYITCGGTQ